MGALIQLAESWWLLYAVHMFEVSLFIFIGVGNRPVGEPGHAIEIFPLAAGIGESLCATFLCHSNS